MAATCNDSNPDGTLDGGLLRMLDRTSLGPDVGPSDFLSDGSLDGTRLGTTDGPSLGLLYWLFDG